MKYFALIFIALSLFSCDDRLDFVNEFNSAPEVFFNGDRNQVQLTDSLKNSLKIGSEMYSLNVSTFDKENTLTAVSFTVPDGYQFFQSGELTNVAILEGTSATLQIKPNGFGLKEIRFTSTDPLGRSGQAILNLFVFDNLPPVARGIFTKLGVNSPWEYEFNFSGSRDKDRNFGGGVQAYVFQINNGEAMYSTKPVNKFAFSGAGGQQLTYWVIDNEGLQSDKVTEVITVQ